MATDAREERVTIRELQRNAAAFFDRARRGENFVVTRSGGTVGRILPPAPTEEAPHQAVTDGVLDADVLDHLPSAAEVADLPAELSPPGTRLGSEAIQSLREEPNGRR